MNYIELFMKHNFISIGEKFAVKGTIKYAETDKIFYIDKNYQLKSDLINSEHSSILIKLLSGTYSIVIDLG